MQCGVEIPLPAPMPDPTPESAPQSQSAQEKIWTDVQWDALSSPHRVQLIGLIEMLGRATTRELSELTGRAGPSLYPHLEILEDAQLVTVETEKGKGRAHRVYCAGPALQWSTTAHGVPDTRGRAVKLAIHWLRDAGLRLERWGAVREGGPAAHGIKATGMMVSETTWLDDEQREELNRRVADLVTFMRKARDERRGRRHNVILYHFPDVTLRDVREHRKARAAGKRH